MRVGWFGAVLRYTALCLKFCLELSGISMKLSPNRSPLARGDERASNGGASGPGDPSSRLHLGFHCSLNHSISRRENLVAADEICTKKAGIAVRSFCSDCSCFMFSGSVGPAPLAEIRWNFAVFCRSSGPGSELRAKYFFGNDRKKTSIE